MPHSVYRVVNTLHDKHYYGVSTDPWKRISSHLSQDPRFGSRLISEDIEKFGRHVFLAQVIEQFEERADAEKLKATLMMRHQSLHPTGYNSTYTSKGVMWNMDSRNKVRGEKNSNSKLSEVDVIAILYDPRGRRKIAKEYQISTALITYIRSGRYWGHIQEELIAVSQSGSGP